jgi:glutamine---fructose-6-phosphate transaminase (isomerizing)
MSLMMKEIHQQPEALARILKEESKHAEVFGRYLASKSINMIVLVARGSSDNAALFGRYLLEISCGLPVSLAAPAVHTLYHSRLKLQNALVVGISQSGEGDDINLVLESARKSGALTLGITNESHSTMTGLVDDVFLIRAGKEKSVAATKTFTGQLLMFYLLAAALNRGRGLDQLKSIPELAAEALKLEPVISRLVERFRFMGHCIVVGRGLNYANAYEFAIKLMETCYVVAERFSSADLLHGPVAMVEADFPLFLFAPPGKTFKDLKSMALKLNSMKAESVIISSEPSILKWATCPVQMKTGIPEILSPIPYIIPGQLFAAQLAEFKGLSPDRPRSLHKITKTV